MTITTERRPLADLIAELAKRLDGFTVAEEVDGRLRELHLVDARGLWVEVAYNGNRIIVSAWHPDSHKLAQNSHRVAWPSASTYAADRDLDIMARDIKRRVIEPSAPVLEKLKADLAQQADDAAALAQTAAYIDGMKIRGLTAEVKDHHDVAVRLYAPAYKEGEIDRHRYASLEARVSLGGYVNIERCSIPLARFLDLLMLLGAIPQDDPLTRHGSAT